MHANPDVLAINHFPWQTALSFDAVIFDCDGTLTSIEGIDELARMNNVFDEVKGLTKLAMEKGAMDVDLYRKRLDLTQPTARQLSSVGELYWENKTPYAAEVIRILQSLNKTVYVMSAGLHPSVFDFAKRLGVPEDNIIAVDLYFDDEGGYTGFDENSPLANNTGKCILVDILKKKHPRILFVGDGMNDVATLHLVDRLIGYGGAYPRKNIADALDFYISTPDFSPVLPLGLTLSEVKGLSGEDLKCYQYGLELITKDDLTVKTTHEDEEHERGL